MSCKSIMEIWPKWRSCKLMYSCNNASPDFNNIQGYTRTSILLRSLRKVRYHHPVMDNQGFEPTPVRQHSQACEWRPHITTGAIKLLKILCVHEFNIRIIIFIVRILFCSYVSLLSLLTIRPIFVAFVSANKIRYIHV